MENPIKAIYQWQRDAGNLENPYNDFLESSFQIEEALEGLDIVACARNLNITLKDDEVTAENLAREIAKAANADTVTVSDVDRLDKACDAIIFAIGSMSKLGLNPQEIIQALLIVNNANKQKLNAKRDSEGKLGKPSNFISPEEKLQELLNKSKQRKKLE